MVIVRLGAAATAFLHKLQKGNPPWVPLKGREEKTFEQAQREAYESKRRDLAVLKANDGVWPGVRIPSHALFLWASGSELTSVLEADHMPNKYIPKDLRYFISYNLLKSPQLHYISLSFYFSLAEQLCYVNGEKNLLLGSKECRFAILSVLETQL